MSIPAFATCLRRTAVLVGASFLLVAAPTPDRSVGMGSAAAAQAPPTADDLILAQARANIATLRQTDVTIEVFGADGRPLAGLPVRVEQTRHRFLFGATDPLVTPRSTRADIDSLSERFVGVFNHVVMQLHWDWYERERGNPQDPLTERLVAWAEQHDLTTKGHPILYPGHEPPWYQQLRDPMERDRAEEIRTRSLVGRFQGRMGMWDVFNEPINLNVFRGMSVEEIADQTERALHWARATDPAATLLVNENRLLNGEKLARMDDLLLELRRRGAPLDGLGIQAHLAAEGRLPLDQVWTNLSHLQDYGPLYLSEVSIPSTARTSSAPAWLDHWSEDWSEESQAEYATKLYTVAFGHPAVQGIVYWVLSDRRATELPGHGLVRDDLTPRPIYEVLRNLIREEWWTRWDGVTDEDGRAQLSAFYGDHRLEVTLGDQKVQLPVTVDQTGQLVRITLEVPPEAP